MANIEIERKFLLALLPPNYAQASAVKITQGFLNADKKRTTRIRVTSDGEAFLTVKGESRGATRVEIETPIDYQKAIAMLDMVEGGLVEKTRRKIEFSGKIWEIDEFLGANLGLLVAEVELVREDEPLDLPPWIGEEITSDHRYANSSLALRPMPRGVLTPKA